MIRMVRTGLMVLIALGLLLAVARPSFAQERKQRLTPEQRFDALEKAVKHDPLTGVLTKDEFIAGVKEVSPKMADRAEKLFTDIKKADEGKVTKNEYVTAMKERYAKRKKKAE